MFVFQNAVLVAWNCMYFSSACLLCDNLPLGSLIVSFPWSVRGGWGHHWIGWDRCRLGYVEGSDVMRESRVSGRLGVWIQ
jgi:hypothetical protein